MEDIAFVGIHTKPEAADEEIDHLVEVYDKVKQEFNTEVKQILYDYSLICDMT